MLIDIHQTPESLSLPGLGEGQPTMGSAPAPADHSIALVTRPIDDYSAALVGEEVELLQQATSSARQQQFSSGRYCVRLCQSLLGENSWPVSRQGKAPVWPGPWLGSISHSDHIAAAVLGSGYHGLGVDLESLHRLGWQSDPRLLQRLFRPEELAAWRESKQPHALSLAFSAKEAGYKAIYPSGQTYIRFQEVAVELHQAGRFTLRYLGDNLTNAAMNNGLGYWSIIDQHVLTLFVVE